MSLPINQVIIGDSGEVMAEWPGNSVDCFVTDPPYRIGFMGKEWDKALPPRRVFRQIFRVLKPGALAFVMSSPRQDVLWRMLAMLEGVGFNLRTSFIVWVYRTGFPKAFDVSKGIDRKLGLKRSKIRYDASEVGNFKGRQDTRPWIEIAKEKGFHEIDDDNPISDDAKQWEGWKSQTGLKPAAECILMVNKPCSEPTICDNVLKWGTGAINVDACRIPYKSTKDSDITAKKNAGNALIDRGELFGGYGDLDPSWQSEKGRFPANLIISNGALDTGETTKSVRSKRGGWIPSGTEIYQGNIEQGRFTKDEAYEAGYNDEGSPFRFFDLDAWAEHHGFLDCAKPSREERNFGLWGMPEGPPPASARSKAAEGRRNPLGDPRANYHPTVKPLKLMAYLIELGCPPKGILVDPFLGSGTTCIAAKKLRRQWIGIEINPEYAEIAQARIDIRGPLDQYMETKK